MEPETTGETMVERQRNTVERDKAEKKKDP